MIEMVYSSKETEELSEVRVPKNIRQIGDNKSNRKIYIEDYVMTSLKKEPDNQNGVKYGVLLGEIKRAKGNTYVFVKGLVETREVIEHSVIFNDDIWADIYKDTKKYFEGLDIIGWFVSVPYTVKNDMTSIQKIHLDNFAGNDKVCYLNDRTEHEDGFFAFESGSMKRQQGYYIFYEKNEKMKRYLKQTNGNRSVSVSTDENLHSGMYESVRMEKVQTLNVQRESMQQANLQKESMQQATLQSEDVQNNYAGEVRNSLENNNKVKEESEGKNKKSVGNNNKKKAEATQKADTAEKVQMTFRDVIKKQIDEEQDRGFKMSNFAYGISSILIIALLLSTVVMLNNYGELRSLKASIESMSGDDSVEAVNEILSSIIPTTIYSEESVNQEMIETEATSGVDVVQESQEIVESIEHNVETNESANEENSEDIENSKISKVDSNDETNSEINDEPDVQIEANSDSGDEEANAYSFNGTYHTVTAGQTLYDISISYYGDSSMVERIKEINSIDDDYMIQEGQELLLP